MTARQRGHAAATREATWRHLGDPGEAEQSGALAEEVPVGLVYNGRPHAVMLATPADLEDFAVGFTLAEGIATLDQLEGPAVVRVVHGMELQLVIPEEAAARLERRTRRLAGRTGCGLCGVEQIAEAVRLPDRPLPRGRTFTRAALRRAAGELAGHQPVNDATRSVHAAAWARADGGIVLAREDVGRHNALDKLVGALARHGLDPSAGFALVTSRASVEMVQKAAAAGIPLLAAVSRPTALAVDVAESAGLTLVGLLRGATANLHSHPERVIDA